MSDNRGDFEAARRQEELSALDLAVAKAEGIADAIISYDSKGENPMCVSQSRFEAALPKTPGPYQPTRDPAEALRLLEKHKLLLFPVSQHDGDGMPIDGDHGWAAASGTPTLDFFNAHQGSTPAIAICRAVVALKARE